MCADKARPNLRPPELTILADHPAQSNPDEPDMLDLHSRLGVVFDILRHKGTNCPITVAVYGDWGTGKTSAMRWLEAQLRGWNALSAKQREGHPKVFPVWFDPWKYHTREDVWRGIIAEVILALFSVQNLDRQTVVPRMIQAAKKFGGFLGKSFLHALASMEVKADAGALGVGAEVTVKGEMFREIYDEFEKTNRPEKPYLNEFEQTLEEWIRGFVGGKGDSPSDRLVLFIDDLDRCLPDVTLEVLEAIKLYLNIRPMAFVVGVDRAVVDGLVAKHYEEKGLDRRKSEQFLDKIFQVEVQIPPSEAQMQTFLDTQIKALDAAADGYWSKMLGHTEHRPALENGIRYLAKHNPREIKRILNSTLLRGRSAADNRALLSRDVADNNLLFAQGVQFFLVQRLVRAKLSSATRLLLESSALQWFQKLSDFLRTNPEFQLPERQISNATETRSGKSSADIHLSPVEQEYEELKRSRPMDDEGRPVDMVLLEDAVLWSLLRIPFSADVAQSAPSLEPRRLRHAPPSSRQSASSQGGVDPLISLPSTITDRVASALGKPVDALVPTDILSVTDLSLSDAEIVDSDLIHLESFSALTTLDLSGTRVTDAGILTLNRVRSLSSLDLSGTHVTDAGISTLTKIKSLRKLLLNRLSLTKVSFSEISKLTSLDELWLGDTPVDDGDVALLAALPLTELYLWRTNVTDIGLKKIGTLRTLTVLDLEGTKVTDTGVSELSNLAGLEILYLSNTQITDAALTTVSNLTHLGALYLDNTQVTDTGIRQLAALPNLMRLGINNTHATSASVNELKQTRPLLQTTKPLK